MPDDFWTNSSDEIIVDGSDQPIDCPDCPCGNTTPCNDGPIDDNVSFVLSLLCNQISTTLTWSATAVGGISEGWAYTGSDIDICDGLRLREVTLWCDGSAWSMEVVLMIRNLLGVYIAQSYTTPSGINTIVTVASSPICLTTSIDSGTYDCGTGAIYMAVGVCNVVPPCCNDSGLSSTATLTYTISGMATATLNLTKTSNDPRYHGSSTCNVGDGHTQIRITYDSDCFCDSAIWQATFLVERLVDGVQTSANVWNGASFVAIGDVRTDFLVSCSPYHLHYEGAGAITGTSLTQSCGGKTYDFTTNNLGIVLDVVTP